MNINNNNNNTRNLNHLKDYIIRPIQKNDLTDLCYLAKKSGIGFTSLPESRTYLANKLKRSIESFEKADSELTSEYYMFALEHLPSKKVVGVSAIESNVGSEELFYHYKIGKLTKASKNPNIRKEHQILSISSDLSNSTEICTLFLLPDHRHKFLGKLLSKSRFLFLKQFKNRFQNKIIAEMRGVSNEDGVSPFWESIGKHFIGLEFPEADYIKGCGHTEFITNLIPENRVYTCLLPSEAQESLGKVHKFTEPAKKLLEQEGFKFKGYIDLFDAGPALHANLNNIQTINHSESYTALINENCDQEITKNALCLISNNKLNQWRVLISYLEIPKDENLLLSQEDFKKLKLENNYKGLKNNVLIKKLIN